MTITTNIPNSLRRPGVYTDIDTSNAIKGLVALPRKAVLIAQKLAAGNATQNIPYQVFGEGDVIDDAGAGSVAHLVAKSFFSAQKNAETWFVYLDDSGSGVAASGSITVTGTASDNGVLSIWIGETQIDVSISNGDANTAVATAINTAIGNNQDVLPLSSTVATNVVTLTARNKGALGNNIPVAYKFSKSITTSIAVVQPTGGSNDPSIQNALDSFFGTNIDNVFVANNDATNLGILKTELQDSAAPEEGRPRKGFFGYTGVQATIETLCGTTLNYERISCGYLKYTKTTEQGHSLDYQVGAAYMGAYMDFDLPNVPRSGKDVNSVLPAALEDEFSRTVIESLLANGVTPLENATGNVVEIVRDISTYTTNAAGLKDIALLDLGPITTLDYLDKQITFVLASKFRHKVISDVVKADIKSEVISVLDKTERLQITRDLENQKDGILVEEDTGTPGRILLEIPAAVVPGLQQIYQKLVLKLTI
jgi:phage tail sheath gpL-like